MKAVIIEDETAAVSSLKAILRHNSVVGIEVVAELESICLLYTSPSPRDTR